MFNKVSQDRSAPQEVDVIIEIGATSGPVKYELDKKGGVMRVDRFMKTAMQYPCNYGLIPDTLSGDGDPCDILVITDYPLISGCVIKVRPLGLLIMEDEGGSDEKIIGVPISKIDPGCARLNSIHDLPSSLLDQIRHFFEHYKDLDSDKWVKITGWGNASRAHELIKDAMARAKDVIASQESGL